MEAENKIARLKAKPSGSTAFTNPEKMNDAAKRKRHVFATTS